VPAFALALHAFFAARAALRDMATLARRAGEVAPPAERFGLITTDDVRGVDSHCFVCLVISHRHESCGLHIGPADSDRRPVSNPNKLYVPALQIVCAEFSWIVFSL
jgi:hypothetical protein